MIVKILLAGAKFNGVMYNTNKVDKGKGELMKVENFGALQALDHLKPKDYINYLQARSKTSARISRPQFHAVISCKGKSHSKEQLTEIATQWLKGMGYGEQPYLLVFHKDTSNNHVHMVSTCIDPNGRKINDSYQKIRAYYVLNQVMDMKESEQFIKGLDKGLGCDFSTLTKFNKLLEFQGQPLKLNQERYQLFDYANKHGNIHIDDGGILGPNLQRRGNARTNTR